MDPISQGIVGTVAAQQADKLIRNRRQLIVVSVLAFLSGMAPDLDILIRSSDDPILFLEYHRQFTHSLIFIPVGGLICATLGYCLAGRRHGLSFKTLYIVCTLAYTTHGLLDACTSYGTLLLWPFSDARIAWHNMSIVDPLYTLPLIVFCVARIKTGKVVWSRTALIWLIAVPLLGVYQRERATTVATQLASQRGHSIERIEVRPSFGNLLLWKSVYETRVNDQTIYVVDAVHTSYKQKIYPGTAIPALDLDKDFPWLDATSQQGRDVERFRWFSNDFLAIDPEQANRIVDMRYSILPQQVKPFWGIAMYPDWPMEQHAQYSVTRHVGSETFGTLGRMIRGQDIDF